MIIEEVVLTSVVLGLVIGFLVGFEVARLYANRIITKIQQEEEK